MKKTLLSTLLVAAFALQHASAAVRSFEYNAVVSSTWNTGGGTIVGPDGNKLVEGDRLFGRFSFDDLGRDWTGTPENVRDLDILDFSVTFAASQQTFHFDWFKWHHEKNNTGGYDFYLSPILLVPSPPPLTMTFVSPANVAFWDLTNGASGSMAATLPPQDDGSRSFFHANVTSISEVSAVPEPSAYAMMLLGLGALGTAAYRRRSPHA